MARETEQKTREVVQLEVKQAYLNIRSAAQKVEETQTVVDQARENYRIQNIRYQAGVGINLDVLDAQLSLNEAQVNHIQALYDYNVALPNWNRLWRRCRIGCHPSVFDGDDISGINRA